jgi:hypothetical protein
VQTADDFLREYEYRDAGTARLIECEMHSKGRRALIITGGHHLLRRSPVDNFESRSLEKASIGDVFQQKHPGKLFVIWTVAGAGDLEAKLSHWPPGSPTFNRITRQSGQIGRKIMPRRLQFRRAPALSASIPGFSARFPFQAPRRSNRISYPSNCHMSNNCQVSTA